MNFSGKSVGTRKTQGIFWELTATEILSDPNKTTYANSFALYVLSEYYLDFHDLSALKWQPRSLVFSKRSLMTLLQMVIRRIFPTTGSPFPPNQSDPAICQI